MRARLLDMGDVSAVRSQSIYHAVTTAMHSDDPPALILLRPVSPCVSVGYFSGPVDVDLCHRRQLPVVQRQDSGEAMLLDGDQLVFQLALPLAQACELGLPRDPTGRCELVARALIAAYRELGVEAEFRAVHHVEAGGRRIGRIDQTELGAGICFAGAVVFDFDPELVAAVLGISRAEIDRSMTSLRREVADPPGLDVIAEALVTACETSWGLELVPSMPTPDEMDAIYEWDQRLVAAHEPRRPRLTA